MGFDRSPSILFSGEEDEMIFHRKLAWIILYLSVPIFLTLQYVIPSPWGKTLPTNKYASVFRYTLPSRWAWFLFEVPNLYWCAIGFEYHSLLVTFFLFLFIGHYLQRAVYYPFYRLSRNSKPVPVLVALSAFSFTNCNGYLQVRALSFRAYTPPPLAQRIVGFALFVFGIVLNYQSDSILLNLRKKATTEDAETNTTPYRIPYGGAFRYVSAPHYLGECIEWWGYAVLTGTWAATVFAVFTAANLVPRAVAHHQWYHRTFPQSYPRDRYAILPGLL